MSRPICVITIVYLTIIIGLHLNGVVFLDFDKIYTYMNSEKHYEGIVISEKEEDYKYVYIVKLKSGDKLINGKKFILNIKKKNNKKLYYGDKISFIGEYNKPNGKRNYGGYDYSLYLKTKRIYGTFEVNNAKLISRDNISKIQKNIYNVREYIKKVLRDNLKEDEANLCIGLIIGDRTAISDNIEQDFKNSNLTHILAISGAHFSYIVLIMTYINKILKRKRLGQILMIIGITLFMSIAGGTASVMRAGIMSIMVILASICHKRPDIWNNLAISILIQLIENPYIIFDIGLQLSYGGVIGIVLFNKQIISKLTYIINNNKILMFIIENISITISANIIIIPIMMLNFNTISFTFILSNLLAAPLLGVLILLTLSLVIFSEIFNSLLNPMFYILNILLKILMNIAKLCSNLPLSRVYVVTPNIILIIAFYCNLILIKFSKSFKRYLVKLLIIIIILNSIIPVIISKRWNLEINFIDVGQGDSTLIRVNNKNILVDAGGSLYQENFDIGEKILFPYLLDRGIYTLDYILISHFDSDHSQGFDYVIENMKIKNAIISDLGQESDEYNKFLLLAKKKGINIIYVKKGDVIKVGNCIIEILYPDKDEIKDNPKNNNAIVCKVIWKDFSILFTGDIEEDAEEKILKLHKNNIEKLKSTVLKVAHHGSKTSSINEFIEAVKPKIALIGVGQNNNFGHPNDEVLNRLQKMGCKIYRTDKNGEIRINLKSSGSIKFQKQFN